MQNNRADGPYNMTASQTHSVGLIVTMVPGYTNNDNQFHIEERDQLDVAFSSDDVEFYVEEAYGPPLEAIEEAFGVKANPIYKENLSKVLAPLMVNRREIKEIADAIASVIYERLQNHILGTRTDVHNPDVHPTGNLNKVTHTLGVSGSMTTTVQIAPNLPNVNWMNLIPDAVRRVMLRQVQV